MQKRYLMVRASDGFIQGYIMRDDPDAGPLPAQQPPPDGFMLVEDPIGFTRVGHSDTEAAYLVDGVVTWVETASLDALRAAKLAQLAGEMSNRIAAVKAGYPDEEVLSWSEQKAEAMAYSADKTVATPLLSSMAAARGITVDDLASRVLVNAQAWSVMSGALIGKRQAYEDQVMAANDAAAVASIVWVD